MATLLLARHGETDWNLNHKWQGHTGPALNETGRGQATGLAARLQNIEAIYSSDTERARETAEIVGAALGLPVATDPRLAGSGLRRVGGADEARDRPSLRGRVHPLGGG